MTKFALLRKFAVLMSLVLLGTANLARAQDAQPAAPILVDTDHQLLIDDYLVAESNGLQRTQHQPSADDGRPVLLPEHPWEHRRIVFGSVHYFPDEKKFKCWYLVINNDDSRPGTRDYRKEYHVPPHEAAFICYAESTDGQHWTKPKLGIHAYRGSKENNIVLTSPGSHFDSTSVTYTPQDEAHPFKMMSFIGRWPYQEDLIKKVFGETFRFGVDVAAHYAWSSTDGIHWTSLNDGKHVLQAGDRSMFWYDPKQKLYVGALKNSHQGKRAQRYVWSEDFVHWHRGKDWLMVADEQDHPRDEAEGAYGFAYGAGYVGFCEMRRVRKGSAKIDWELMVSRDGRNWSRPLREPFIANGPKESWRHSVVKIFTNPPIERDGELLIFYSGDTGLVDYSQGYEPFQGMGLARLRKDGFVSIDGDDQGGTLVTRPVLLTGEHMHLNAAAENGDIRVEVRDLKGNTIPGFSADDCQPITANTVDQTVRWKTVASLTGLRDRPVQLVFSIRNAQLYSIWSQ